MKYLGKIQDDKDLVTKEYVDNAVAGGGGGGGSGTVTSVGITEGSGISVSGSPITTSGSITVGHSNSVSAQTTQAVYPIQIDASGHISGYGSAVTIPSFSIVKKTISNISLTASGDVSSNSSATTNDIGIVGYNLSGTGATQVTINRLYMDSGKVYYQMRNLSSTARTLALDVYMLRKG